MCGGGSCSPSFDTAYDSTLRARRIWGALSLPCAICCMSLAGCRTKWKPILGDSPVGSPRSLAPYPLSILWTAHSGSKAVSVPSHSWMALLTSAAPLALPPSLSHDNIIQSHASRPRRGELASCNGVQRRQDQARAREAGAKTTRRATRQACPDEQFQAHARTHAHTHTQPPPPLTPRQATPSHAGPWFRLP